MIILPTLRLVTFLLMCFSASYGALAQVANVPTSMVGVADDTIYNLISASGTTVSVSGLDPLKVVLSASSGTLKIPPQLDLVRQQATPLASGQELVKLPLKAH